MVASGSTRATLEPQHDRLTGRQQVFINEYLRCLNASKAARVAGYKPPFNVAGAKVMASQKVKGVIDKQLRHAKLTPESLMERLQSQMAFSMDDFVDVNPATGKVTLTLAEAKAIGAMAIVKRIRQRPDGEVMIEVRDAMPVVEAIIRILALIERKNVDEQYNEERENSFLNMCKPRKETSGTNS